MQPLHFSFAAAPEPAITAVPGYLPDSAPRLPDTVSVPQKLVRKRTQPQYVYPSAPYQARVPDRIQGAIAKACEAAHPQMGLKAQQVFRAWASLYCRGRRLQGWTASQARATLASAFRSCLGTDASHGTLERYWSIFEAAGAINVGRVGALGSRIIFVKLTDVIWFNGGEDAYEAAANQSRQRDAARKRASRQQDRLSPPAHSVRALPKTLGTGLSGDALKRPSVPLSRERPKMSGVIEPFERPLRLSSAEPPRPLQPSSIRPLPPAKEKAIADLESLILRDQHSPSPKWLDSQRSGGEAPESLRTRQGTGQQATPSGSGRVLISEKSTENQETAMTSSPYPKDSAFTSYGDLLPDVFKMLQNRPERQNSSDEIILQRLKDLNMPPLRGVEDLEDKTILKAVRTLGYMGEAEARAYLGEEVWGVLMLEAKTWPALCHLSAKEVTDTSQAVAERARSSERFNKPSVYQRQTQVGPDDWSSDVDAGNKLDELLAKGLSEEDGKAELGYLRFSLVTSKHSWAELNKLAEHPDGFGKILMVAAKAFDELSRAPEIEKRRPKVESPAAQTGQGLAQRPKVGAGQIEHFRQCLGFRVLGVEDAQAILDLAPSDVEMASAGETLRVAVEKGRVKHPQYACRYALEVIKTNRKEAERRAHQRAVTRADDVLAPDQLARSVIAVTRDEALQLPIMAMSALRVTQAEVSDVCGYVLDKVEKGKIQPHGYGTYVLKMLRQKSADRTDAS